MCLLTGRSCKPQRRLQIQPGRPNKTNKQKTKTKNKKQKTEQNRTKQNKTKTEGWRPTPKINLSLDDGSERHRGVPDVAQLQADPCRTNSNRV
jgi:hypothetical protein